MPKYQKPRTGFMPYIEFFIQKFFFFIQKTITFFCYKYL